MAWVSVKDRLPEQAGYYLCWWCGKNTPKGMMDVLNFDGEKFPWETIFLSHYNKVAYWMPLPAPPKECEK